VVFGGPAARPDRRNRIDARSSRGPEFPPTIGRGFVFASSSAAAALYVQLFFRVVSLGLVARTLGPTAQGTVALATLLATAGTGVASVGLDVSLLRLAARPEDRETAHAGVWTQSLLITAVTPVALAVLAATGHLTTPAAAGIAAIPGFLFLRLAASCALAAGRLGSFIATSTTQAATYCLGLIALAVAGELTPTAAVVVFAITANASAIGAALWVRAWLRPQLLKPSHRTEPYRTAMQVFPGSVAHLANSRFDQFVIAALLSRRELGLYSVATAAAEILVLPTQAFANALLPHARRRRFSSEPLRVARIAPAAAFTVLAGAPFVFVAIKVFLPRYDESLLPFALLLPGVAALGVGGILAAFITGAGEPWRPSQIALVTLGLTVITTLVAVPLLGIAGAALASSVAYAVSMSLLIRAVRRLHPLPEQPDQPVGAAEYERQLPG